MTSNASRAALITGCSSGIGHATALRLRKAGFEVYATARRPESLADLTAAGITTLPLDVTDEATMAEAVDRITAEQGAVALLVNNAGYELAGPVEEIPLAEARRQFDTNFFGLARLAQLVIPGMRARHSGRIINLSSVFGRIAVPGGAYYDASKHAVTGFTHALRLELAAFGIHVILVEPTAALTSLNANIITVGDRDGGPYAAFRHDLADWHAQTYSGQPSNVAGRLAVSADDVAAVIARAATTRRPEPGIPSERSPAGCSPSSDGCPAAHSTPSSVPSSPHPGDRRRYRTAAELPRPGKYPRSQQDVPRRHRAPATYGTTSKEIQRSMGPS